MQVDHGVGKTNFLLDMALSGETKALIFSLEMSEEGIRKRLCENEKYIGNKLLIDSTPHPSIDYIEEQCRKMKQIENIGIVVIDYIQLVKNNNDITIYKKIGDLCKELNVTMFVGYMLSGVNITNEKPSFIDIKQKEVVEIADRVIILHKEHNEKIELIFVKSASGKVYYE